MAIRMQQRTGTYDQWNTSNPILNGAEIGYESDTNKFKIGDGTNHWNDLPYFLDEVTLGTSLDGYIPDSLLGVANGVAQLNSSGKLVSDQIPNVDEITQDAINAALVAGTGLDKTYDDNANTITIDIDSTVATKTYADTAVTNAVSGLTKSSVGLGNVDNTSDANKPVSTATQTALDLKADASAITELAQDAVNTALVAGTGLDKTYDDASNTITIDIDSTVATKTYVDDAIGSFEALPSQTSNTGKFLTTDGSATSWATVDLSSKQDKVTGVSDTEIGYLDGVTSAIQTQIDSKAPTASPTFTGTVSGVTKAHVGLGDVDNTSDTAKPISTATQTELDLKAPLASPALTGTPTAPTATAGTNSTQVATTAYADAAVAALVDAAPATLNTLNELAAAINDDASYAATITTALGNKQDKVTGVSDTEIGYLDGVTSAIQTQINNKASLESPTFTGTVSGVTKTHVGLGNVDNTADVDKPVSDDTQAALDLKADLAGPTFTGTVDFTGATITGLPAAAFVQMTTVAVSSNITLESNKRYFIDTAAARTLTLPASPANGDEIQIFDVAGTAATNNITVASNSLKINGTVQDLLIDINYDVVVLAYTGSTYGWVVL